MAEPMTATGERDNSHGQNVRREILRMGLQLWCVDPAYVTARKIANELQMTHGNVLHHFQSSLKLRDAIAYYAVKEGESRVIANLILTKHSAIAHLSEAERLEHLQRASVR